MDVTYILNLNVDNADIASLIQSAETLKLVLGGYSTREIEAPEWMLAKLDNIEAEINIRNRAELSKALRLEEQRRATMKTIDEKRADSDARIAALKTKLGK